MSSKALALLLADLGVTKSHSRPHVCDPKRYNQAMIEVRQTEVYARWFGKPSRQAGKGTH